MIKRLIRNRLNGTSEIVSVYQAFIKAYLQSGLTNTPFHVEKIAKELELPLCPHKTEADVTEIR